LRRNQVLSDVKKSSEQDGHVAGAGIQGFRLDGIGGKNQFRGEVGTDRTAACGEARTTGSCSYVQRIRSVEACVFEDAKMRIAGGLAELDGQGIRTPGCGVDVLRVVNHLRELGSLHH